MRRRPFIALNGCFSKECESLATVGLRLQASTSDPRVFFVFREHGRSVGVLTILIDDISGCWKKDVMVWARRCLERRLGALGTQAENFARVDTELVPGEDFSGTATQQKFTGAPKSFPATKE